MGDGWELMKIRGIPLKVHPSWFVILIIATWGFSASVSSSDGSGPSTLTSLGFGHVGAIALVLHSDAFVAALSQAQRADWQERSGLRLVTARRAWTDVILGRRKLFAKRTDRRFVAPDGSDAQADEEARMLLDPRARFEPDKGVYDVPGHGGGR